MIKELSLNEVRMTKTFDVSQFESGKVLEIFLDEDVTNYIVKYIIQLKNGNVVSHYCNVRDGHYVSFTLPENATQEAGTLEAQLIIYDQSMSSEDEIRLWMQQVLAGLTPVMISMEDNPNPVAKAVENEENIMKRVSTFIFNIKVHRSIGGANTTYETLMEEAEERLEAMKTIEDNINKIYPQLTSMLSEGTEMITEGNGVIQEAGSTISRLETVGDYAQEQGDYAKEQGQIAEGFDLDSIKERITNLEDFNIETESGLNSIMISMEEV